MEGHSVESHLHVNARAYDEAIRAFVPHYDELLESGVEFLSALAPGARFIVDLGGGTGALTEVVLRGMPGPRVELLDIDPRMLQEAGRRLAPHAARVSFREGSFRGPLPAADAFVASLSLHHLHDLEEKTVVYAAIEKALVPGGVFLNLDAVVSGDPRLSSLTFDRWVAWMNAHGISPEEGRRHLQQWSREDKYYPLHAELDALRRAGFPEPECFWRKGPLAVYGALKRRN